MEIKNSLILKKVEEAAEKAMKEINKDYIEPIHLPNFEYNGFTVTVPIFDETLRDEVDMIEYYGEENIREYFEDAIRKDFI